jgi:hypothetical protein
MPGINSILRCVRTNGMNARKSGLNLAVLWIGILIFDLAVAGRSPLLLSIEQSNA